MGNKHDYLQRREIIMYEPDSFLEEHLKQIIDHFRLKNRGDFKILDWGCGRGRGVLYFLEKGYDAYGVDIDMNTIKKGSPLLREMGYDPNKRLLMPSGLKKFKDGFFHFIFSEQVFEHVENLGDVVKSQKRLMKTDGLGCHIFPAAKKWLLIFLLL